MAAAKAHKKRTNPKKHAQKQDTSAGKDVIYGQHLRAIFGQFGHTEPGGADLKSVPAIFGHANAGATLNFCGKADLQQIKTAADKLGMAFGLSTGPLLSSC